MRQYYSITGITAKYSKYSRETPAIKWHCAMGFILETFQNIHSNKRFLLICLLNTLFESMLVKNLQKTYKCLELIYQAINIK